MACQRIPSRTLAAALLLCSFLGPLSARASAEVDPPRDGKLGGPGEVDPGAAVPAPAALQSAALLPPDDGGAKGPSRYGIVLPAEHTADLQAHWSLRRAYLRERDERRAEDEEQRVRELKKDLGLDNLYFIGAALVRESDEALSTGSADVARKRCALAVALAPALPAAHTCLARSLFAQSAFALKPVLSQLVEAARASAADPRLRRTALANFFAIVFAGALIGGIAFIAFLLGRHGRLYGHDAHHFFPAGARRWQTLTLAVAALLLPLLLRLGPIPALLAALAACALYASTLEIAVGSAVLVLVAAVPFALEALGRAASFAGPQADVFLLERGEGSPAAVARLQRRLAAQPEFAVAFALARKAKREGNLSAAEALYGKALETPGAGTEAQAAARTDLGNVLLLRGDASKARAQYEQALDLSDSLAAAHFNLGRALGLGGVEFLDKVQEQQTRALDLDRASIEAFTEGSLQVNRKANRFVMDVPLPRSSLEALASTDAALASPVREEALALVSGRLPAGSVPLLSVSALAAVWMLRALRARLRPSTRCNRCEREVCKRCDADARPSEALCAQCVNAFVLRDSVDPTARIRKESSVRAHLRRRVLLLRALSIFSGGSHVIMGHPLRGAAYLCAAGMIVASVLFSRGLAHDPIAVQTHPGAPRLAILACAAAALCAVSIRDLLARQQAEGA